MEKDITFTTDTEKSELISELKPTILALTKGYLLTQDK